MADPQVLASVIRISGRVLARNEDGETRELKLGDTVREGETVITDAGGQIELLFVDGSVTEVAERTTALISAEMSADARPDAAAASIGEATIAQVVEALERGYDLDAVLEEPAAGLTGGGGGDGSGFVRLLRISEAVGETEFAFASAQGNTDFPFEGATAAAAAEQGQTPPPAPAPVDLAIELVAPPFTNDGTPTISGTTDAPAGSSVRLVVTDALGATQTIVVSVDAQGGFSGAPSLPLADGPYQVTAVVEDGLGNVGNADGEGLVDTLAPSVTVTINADGTVSFMFSEAPVGFEATDVAVSNGTITNLVQDPSDPTRWTASLTPTAGFEGAMVVSVPAGSYTDAVGNSGLGGSDSTTVDTLAPRVMVTINADGTVSFVFSEAPVGFEATDVSVANGTITNLVQDPSDPTRWAANLAPTAGFEGAVVVDVPAGSYTDAAGNLGLGDSDSSHVDTLAPSVTVTINADGTVSFVFSEAPVGFEATDVAVSNGTITNLVQDPSDPTRWTASLTPNAGFEGAITVGVPTGSYADAAGNLGLGDSDSTPVDTLAPSVTVTINADGTVSFVFSEAPVGFEATDVAVSNGTITNLIQDPSDPTRWAANLTPNAGFEDAVVVSVSTGSYTDGAGNLGLGGSDSTTVDTLAPSVTVTINADGTVSFVFSEAPVGFEATDVAVSNGTITNLVQDPSDPTRWTASLTPNAGFEGAVVVDVPAGSYTDGAGNLGLGGSDSTTVDTLAPSVTVTINADGTVSFVFSEAPVGFEATDVSVANGTITNLVQDPSDPTRWTASLTPNAGFEGAVVVDVPAGSYTDGAGNLGLGGSDSTTVDTLAPSVTVTINADGTVSFVFSEAPVGFETTDVAVSNGTITNLVQDPSDPTRWTANLTPTAGFEGAVVVSVPAGSYTDTAGNAGLGDSDSSNVDTLAPSVTVTINADGTVSFVFSEAPVGFEATDVAVSNGTITNLVQDPSDPTRWTASLTPNAGFEGAVVVDVPAGSYTDGAGNLGLGGSDSTTVDTLAPSVTVTINADGTVSFVFSEAPVGFETTDVAVSNGTITNLIQDPSDPTRWAANLTPTAGFEGAVVVSVPAGSYTDTAGNAGLGDSDSSNVDTLAPSVTVTINADGTVSFVFSEAPVGFEATDVAVSNGTITNLVQDPSDPTRWTANLTPTAGFEGAVVVSVPAGSYTDTAGNAGLGDSDSSNVDTLAPSVTVTINADGTVSFVFSEAPVGFEATDVAVSNGTVTNLIQDPSDPTWWTASLTPNAGFEGAVVVDVPAGSYTDGAGNLGLGGSDSTTVDTLAPSVTVTINADGTVSFVFSEAPVGFETTDVAVSNGTITNLIQDPSDPTRWAANLTPTAGFEGAVVVDVPAGSYTDTAGNAGLGDSDSTIVDTLAPSVTVTINADGTVSFVFSEAPVGFEATDVSVANGTITNLVQDPSDPTRWTASLTPNAGFEGAVVVSVPAGSYTDAAGNLGLGDSDSSHVDTLAPSVTVTINADGTVSFVFSEAPVGFETTDVAVSNGTITNLVQDPSDPTRWTASLTPNAGFEGTVVVDVPAGSYTDGAGNLGLGGSDSTTVDTLAPSVTVTINADGTVSFVFSEAPVGFEATDVAVSNGTITNLIQDPSDPTRWAANLTPTAGFEGAVVVSVPAGSYTDTAGNAGLGDSDSTTVDTLAPSVTVTINADGTVSFVFSEAPVGFEATDVSVANGTITNLIQDPSDLTRWTASLTPNAGFEGAVVVSVPAGSYTDAVGNSGLGGSDSTTVDTLAPRVMVTINADGTVSFVFSEAPVGFEATDVSVANGTITNLVQDPSDPTRWTASLTPNAGFEGAVVVDVPADSYTDGAGNLGLGDSDVITVGTPAPSVTVDLSDVNSTNLTATPITGTTAGVEPGQTVLLTVTDGINTVVTSATVGADGSYGITANLSTLIDGTLTVTAVVSNLAGNSATDDDVGVKAIADAPILAPINDIFMLTAGDTVISTGSTDKVVSPGAVDAGSGVALSALEKELGLPNGFLDKRFDPSGPNVVDPGAVSVLDGKLTESHQVMTSGTTVNWDYVFTNGENLSWEVAAGFNDLVVLLVTDPLGNKQATLVNASEVKFPASSISDSFAFTATMDGEYTFQWVLLNGGDRIKDSSLELGAATFTVAGDSTAYGAPVRLPIFAGLMDTDGSETLSVVVAGVPAGGRFTSGTDNGDGSWAFAASELGNLVFLPPAGFSGAIDLRVSAIATESVNGDAAVTQQTVRVTIDQTDSTYTDGSEKAQTISGTTGDDLIRGYAGNDTINAGTGDDLVYGGADNDTLRGDAGNDWLYGGQGADTLYGGAGNDVLSGGASNDVLYGGAGADVFKWSLGDQGSTSAPAVDVVKDFSPSQGDALDLRDLLIGESHQGIDAGNLADYLSFDFEPGAGGATGATVIAVKTHGAAMSGPDQIIRLESIDLLGGVSDDQQIIQNLLASGKLITD